VDRQRTSFKRYGVWGDWDDPYLTLQPEYEAAQIRVFGDMVLKVRWVSWSGGWMGGAACTTPTTPTTMVLAS
jgi:hypothetical protein